MVLKFADDIKVVRVIQESKDQETFQSDLDKLVKCSESLYLIEIQFK